MYIVQRKDGRTWTTVLTIPTLEGEHLRRIEFLIQCGVDLKLSWKDNRHGN